MKSFDEIWTILQGIFKIVTTVPHPSINVPLKMTQILEMF